MNTSITRLVTVIAWVLYSLAIVGVVGCLVIADSLSQAMGILLLEVLAAAYWGLCFWLLMRQTKRSWAAVVSGLTVAPVFMSFVCYFALHSDLVRTVILVLLFTSFWFFGRIFSRYAAVKKRPG